MGAVAKGNEKAAKGESASTLCLFFFSWAPLKSNVDDLTPNAASVFSPYLLRVGTEGACFYCKKEENGIVGWIF